MTHKAFFDYLAVFKEKKNIFPLISFVICMLFFALLFNIVYQNNVTHMENKLKKDGELLIGKLRGKMLAEIKAINRLFYRVESNSYQNKKAINKDVENYFIQIPSLIFVDLKKINGRSHPILSKVPDSTMEKKIAIVTCEHMKDVSEKDIAGESNVICIYDKKTGRVSAINFDFFIKDILTSQEVEKFHISTYLNGFKLHDQGGVFYGWNRGVKPLSISFDSNGSLFEFKLTPSDRFFYDYNYIALLLVFGFGLIVSITTSIVIRMKVIAHEKNRYLNEMILKNQETNTLLYSIIENSPGMFFVIDLEGKITFTDSQTVSFLGYKYVSNLIDRQLSEIIPMISGSTIDALAGKSKNPDDDYISGREMYILTKKQQHIPIDITFISITSHHKKSVLCCAFDIRERNQYKEHITKQAIAMQLLYDAISTISNIDDTHKSLQICIDLICEAFKFPIGHIYIISPDKDKLLPTDIWYTFDSKKVEDFKEVTARTPFEKGEGLPGRIWASRKPSWIEDIQSDENFPRVKLCKSVVIKGAVGFPIIIQQDIYAVCEFFFYEAIARDEDLIKVLSMMGRQIGRIFERRMAQEALFEAEAQNRLLLEHAGEGIYGLDLNGKVTFINPAAARMLGYLVDELQGELMHNKVHYAYPDGSYYPRDNCPMHAVLTDDTLKKVRDEVLWRKDGSSFWVEYTSTPVYFKGKLSGSVIIFTDISEKKKIEQIKSELISTINHELRTPLTAIQSSVWILQQTTSGKLDEKENDMLAKCYKNCQHLSSLVNDILDMEKISIGMMQYHLDKEDIIELTKDIVSRYQNLSEKYSVNFIFNVIDVDSAICVVDKIRYEQALLNLISNAAKFSLEGEDVTITVCKKTESIIEISVADNGIGISPEFQEKMFQRFAQGDSSSTRKQPGTGLGLYISREIVRAFKGDITFKSELNVGSVFYIELPLSGR